MLIDYKSGHLQSRVIPDYERRRYKTSRLLIAYFISTQQEHMYWYLITKEYSPQNIINELYFIVHGNHVHIYAKSF